MYTKKEALEMICLKELEEQLNDIYIDQEKEIYNQKKCCCDECNHWTWSNSEVGCCGFFKIIDPKEIIMELIIYDSKNYDNFCEPTKDPEIDHLVREVYNAYGFPTAYDSPAEKIKDILVEYFKKNNYKVLLDRNFVILEREDKSKWMIIDNYPNHIFEVDKIDLSEYRTEEDYIGLEEILCEETERPEKSDWVSFMFLNNYPKQDILNILKEFKKIISQSPKKKIGEIWENIPLITLIESIDIRKFDSSGSLSIIEISEEIFAKIAIGVFDNYSKDSNIVAFGRKYYEHFPEYLRGCKEYPVDIEREIENGTIGLIIQLKPNQKFQIVSWSKNQINNFINILGD